MSGLWSRLAGAVLAASLASPAAAETLTLERALELAEQTSPRLRIATAQLDGARSGVVTARQYPNPEVEAAGGRQSERIPGAPTGSNAVLGVSQPIDLPSVRDPRIRSAEAGAEAGEFALAEARLNVRAQVKQAFYDVLRRRAEFDLAADSQGLFQEIRNRIKIRVDVGESPRFELTRADAELQREINVTNSARLRVTQAVAVLRAAIGAPLPADLDVVGRLPPMPALPGLEALRAEALANYPAIRLAEAEVRRAQARLETERALRFPQPTLRAGVEREPDIDKWRLGLSIPIPLFNQRQGQIGEAVAAFQQSTVAAELARIDVRAAVETAYSRLEVAQQQIAAFEGGLLNEAENALRVAEAAFRFGERGFIDVLDAQRVLRQVRADFLSARFEQQAALIELERLRAQDLERTLR